MRQMCGVEGGVKSCANSWVREWVYSLLEELEGAEGAAIKI
jgi:hypothetical protein